MSPHRCSWGSIPLTDRLTVVFLMLTDVFEVMPGFYFIWCCKTLCSYRPVLLGVLSVFCDRINTSKHGVPSVCLSCVQYWSSYQSSVVYLLCTTCIVYCLQLFKDLCAIFLCESHTSACGVDVHEPWQEEICASSVKDTHLQEAQIFMSPCHHRGSWRSMLLAGSLLCCPRVGDVGSSVHGGVFGVIQHAFKWENMERVTDCHVRDIFFIKKCSCEEEIVIRNAGDDGAMENCWNCEKCVRICTPILYHVNIQLIV